MQQKILTIGVATILLFLFACATSNTENENPGIPPNIWQIKKAENEAGCINLTGEYQLWGEAPPQGPATFRGMPYSLDVMAGPYLTHNDQKKIIHVGITHRGDKEITFIFFMRDGILTQRSYYSSEKVQILCSEDRVTLIQKSLKTTGEATRGSANITDTYFLSEDGSLIINTVIEGVNKSLLSFKRNYREEYWAKFKLFDSTRR